MSIDLSHPSAERNNELIASRLLEHQNRRAFLKTFGTSMAGWSLSGIFPGNRLFAAPASAIANPLAPKPRHFPVKAKTCIFLYMYGGPSQMDLFDYKPELQKFDGKEVDMEIRRRDIKKSKLLGSRRTFERRGQSGLWCSDAFPNIARHMDKMAVIKSLYMDSFAHGSANLQMNCGRILQGHPSLGAWMAHGLGSSNPNLPGFVVMLDPRGGPIPGAANWTAGYMPAAYQGTVLRAEGNPILNLQPPDLRTLQMQRDHVNAINAFNERHRQGRETYSELSARIASYDLAYQLHTSAPEALDLSSESESTLEMYGFNEPKAAHPLAIPPAHFGRQCLIARRLVERGVRFVQLYSGGGHQQQNWDAHHGVEENLKIHCPEVDKPIAGLLQDLEQRGLLDETLVVWGGEFGRQPVWQGDNGGRDHNPKGFTYWLAGGGVKAGTSYGETDPLGHEAVSDRHHVRDLHATILHLMGLDHERLVYHYGGLDQKLTGVVPAEPIRGVIA
ncbi:MAG: DUF1501 domain-containing protein [Verrucomicrobia bacterium]|jgi:hypothetical protein|nr:DUF1501 domain-containing protein [Verrucomicrobiota bacterium]MBT6237159.1 DUF1501 domain-containing protein [Verrucomicrobiota bacterium]MBT7873177.1 DUF1501 domain-containing protein [Verrucomicrobiota bacterium]